MSRIHLYIKAWIKIIKQTKITLKIKTPFVDFSFAPMNLSLFKVFIELEEFIWKEKLID